MTQLSPVSAQKSSELPGFPSSLVIDGNTGTYTATGHPPSVGEWIAVEAPAGSAVGWVRLHWSIETYFGKVEVYVATTPGLFDATASLCGIVENCGSEPCVADIYCGYAAATLPAATFVCFRKSLSRGADILVLSEVLLFAG